MKKRSLALGAAALLAALVAPAAEAQVFTPTYMSPMGLSDLGIYVSDGPGDLTLEGIWRGGPLGLRVGFVDSDVDDLLSLGGEFRSPIALQGAPIGLAFVAGAQGLLGDNSAVGLQAGVSAGYRFVQPGFGLTPYIHPRIALIDGFGPDDDFEAEVLADVGVDLELPNRIVFRLGVGLSDETADWGLGLAWRR